MNSVSSASAQLLFLPGALGKADFWEPLGRKLRLSAEKIFVSYPGFGGTAADPSITCFGDLVNAIVSRIDRPTALIAQSMGGVLAIEAVIRKRSLVTHLVLIATSGGLDTSKFGALDWRQEFRRHNPDLPDWFESYRSDLTRELKNIEVPVLLIWGDSDPLSPVAVGETLASQFPNAQLHIVPGGEHDLAYKHAHLIAPLIDMHLLKDSPRAIED